MPTPDKLRNTRLERWERAATWIGLACVTTFIVYSLFPIRNAWWSIIDDHRKPYIFVQFHGLSFSDILHHFWHAVDFPPLGQSPRVQPMFHVLNELELHFFGLHPEPWYLLRIVCALVFGVFLYTSLARLYNATAALFLSLALLLPAYQSQVFLRLGVAECYIAPAFAIALWIGSRPEPASGLRRAIVAAVYCLCLVICLGSKEVMLAFVPAITFQVIRDARTRGLRSERFYAGVFGIAFGLFVAVCILLGLRNQQTDIYGNSLSITHRLAMLVKDGWLFHPPMLALLAGIILLGVARAGKPENRNERMRRFGGSLFVPSLVIVAAYLGSVIFYNCDIPPNSHYEFPVTGLATAGLFLTVIGGGEVFILLVRRARGLRPVVSGLAGAVCMIVVLAHTSPFVLRMRAEAIRDDTLSFKAKFLKLEAVAKANPGLPIVFHSCGFNDVEPTDSVLRFLRGFGVRNTIILDLKVVRAMKPSTPWEAYLKQLQLSKKAGPHTFDTISDNPKGPAINIDFSNPALSNGATLNFWPMR